MIMENAVRPGSAPPPPPAAAPAIDLTGKTIGEFRILRRIGQGGMGQVYLAEQASLKRQVALKIMRPDVAANPTSVQRFQREAEAVAKVTHANIVQVYAFGQADGLYYMALEYVDGKNLSDYVAKKGPPDLLLALSILRQVAAGLQRASENGIVHRDIKPENILLTRKGEVKVTDFGLSRCFGGEQEPLSLTQTGVSMGTPLYMSPEQVQGKEVDPRSDIYSLGVTAYHMLTGQPPFLGQNGFEVALQHVQNQAVPLQERRPDLPVELCQVVQRMMAKDPGERYQTAKELLRDLTRLREGLSGKPGAGVEAIQLTQSQPVVTAGNLIKAAPATQAAVPAQRAGRRVWLVALVVASIVAAAAAGFWLRLRQDNARQQPAQTAVGEVSRQPPVDLQEQALLETVRKPLTPGNAEDFRRHRDTAVQLGVIYLEQRRLKEADAFFKELRDRQAKGETRLHYLGKLGQALVLAFQDRPKESNDLFLELEKGKPAEMYLLRSPQSPLRPLVAEAISRNAVNLAPERLPAELEGLRRLPGPK
jgi:tRNA A-37 threonylcarbamoyl transferase component Bud32